jgi:hypothetical protein
LRARAAEGITPAIAHFPRFSYCLRSGSDSGVKITQRPSLTLFLESLSFSWNISDAPLAARAISPLSLARYASVHRFLLRVRAASVRLRDVRSSLVEASRALRPRQIRGWAATGREDAVFAGTRALPVSLFTFRHEAAHVIGALDGYVTTAIVSASWREFLDAVGKAAAHGGNIEALREAHDAYTASLERRCFLPVTTKVDAASSAAPAAVDSDAWADVEALENRPRGATSSARSAHSADTKSGTLALSGSSAAASRLLDVIIDYSIGFADLVDRCIGSWTARGASPDERVFDASSLEATARMASGFRASARALRAGLDAVASSGGGFSVHISDLLARLGPAVGSKG